MTTPAKATDLTALPAGRELDALVAEQLFGWAWYTVVNINLLLPPNHSYRNRPVLATPGQTPGSEIDVDSTHFYNSQRDGFTMPIVPRYSTELRAAFEVQAELERRGFWMQLRSTFGLGQYADGWWCGFTPHLTTGFNGRPDYSAQAATPAHALCLAALLTLNDHPTEI